MSLPIYRRFKGTASDYTVLHLWVRTQLGTPSICNACGLNDPSLRYEWANVSGKYHRDLSDWTRLCVRCHRKMDGGPHRDEVVLNGKTVEVCKRGHMLTANNSYLVPKTGNFECVACRKLRQLIANAKARARREHLRANSPPVVSPSGTQKRHDPADAPYQRI